MGWVLKILGKNKCRKNAEYECAKFWIILFMGKSVTDYKIGSFNEAKVNNLFGLSNGF